jgi:biotin carboxyl carrier protein
MVGGSKIMNEFLVRINDSIRQVKIIDQQNIEVDDKRLNYSFTELDGGKIILKIENKFYEASYSKREDGEFSLLINNESLNLTIRTSLQEKAYQLLSASQNKAEHSKTIKSPMPGLVVKVIKNVGDKIIKGDTVMILEAMKMENEIKSNLEGILSEIFVEQGKPIEKNIPLFTIK